MAHRGAYYELEHLVQHTRDMLISFSLRGCLRGFGSLFPGQHPNPDHMAPWITGSGAIGKLDAVQDPGGDPQTALDDPLGDP